MKPNKSLYIPSTGHTYAYIHCSPSINHPTLLFLHGFPSTSHDWHHQITHFSSLGYGIIAPDLLGYGLTSKPLLPSPYIGSSMSLSLLHILDHERVEKVIGIAHDWGTYLLSQFYIYHPERVEKLVFLSVPFNVPGRKGDVERINSVSKSERGFESLGYWVYFTGAEAGREIGEKRDRFFPLVYRPLSQNWSHDFAALGALRSYLFSSTPAPNFPSSQTFVTEEDKTHHFEAFGTDYSAPLMWYHRGINNLGVNDEVKLLKEGNIKQGVEVQTLMLGGTKDVVCDCGRADMVMRACVGRGLLKVVNVDAGHWIMLEKVKETNQALQDFFENGAGKLEARL